MSELVDYPPGVLPRDDPMINITQALKDTEKTAIDLFEATVARSIMTPS